MKHSSFCTVSFLLALCLLAVSGCKKVVLPPGTEAFYNTNLSGALLIPDDVTEIRNGAFRGSNVSSVMFGNKLVTIGSSAFYNCESLTGELNLSDSLCSIGDYAFINCSFTGRLILPDCLEYIGDHAFDSAGNFVGDLVIPEKIIKLENNVFPQTTFSAMIR